MYYILKQQKHFNNTKKADVFIYTGTIPAVKHIYDENDGVTIQLHFHALSKHVWLRRQVLTLDN